MPIITIEDVWKKYHLQNNRPRTLKAELVRRFRPKQEWELEEEQRTFWALKGVSFDIEQGDTIGIIGDNGSGKSTLLKLITGISRPSRGRVGVGGRVSALLELGAGFHPDFSGRENVFINGTILGLSKQEIRRRFDAIVAFSELAEFIDRPVKTYSSGMYMRLAFAVAINVDAQILVIDEVLAVGDVAFQQKCIDEIMRIRDSGVTIVFVSHGLGSVQQLCRRAAWMDHGQLKAIGSSRDVIEAYNEQVNAAIGRNRSAAPGPLAPGALQDLAFLDADGNRREAFEGGGPGAIVFDASGLPGPGAGSPDIVELPCRCEVRVMRSDGVCCYDQTRHLAGPSACVRLALPFLPLHSGHYSVVVRLVAGEDRLVDERSASFAVAGATDGPGIGPLSARWEEKSVAAGFSAGIAVAAPVAGELEAG